MSDAATFKISTKRRANITFRTKRRIGVAGMADALGAAETVPIHAGPDTPLGFVALRKEVAKALRSTGGRPGLDGTVRRKIPVTEKAWKVVSEAAEQMSDASFHPSPAQVASVMLELAVHDLPGLVERAEIALRTLNESPWPDVDEPQKGMGSLT